MRWSKSHPGPQDGSYPRVFESGYKSKPLGILVALTKISEVPGENQGVDLHREVGIALALFYIRNNFHFAVSENIFFTGRLD